MKRGLEAFTSEQVAALRISIAFLFLLPITIMRLRKPLLKYTAGAAAMGFFGNLLPAFMFTKAETLISAAMTGMLNSLTPVFTLVLGIFMLRQKVKWLQVVGVIIGLVGAIGLLSLDQTKDNSHDLLVGGSLVVIATLFYGLSVNIIKLKLSDLNPVTATAFALSFIGPFALIYLFTTDFTDRMQTHPLAYQSLGYIFILAVFGTALSVIVYNILIREAGTMFAASVTYLMPIVAMGWGIYEHESVTWLHFLFIVIILSGIWLINRKIRSSD
jgi:drug/metabolite transporter (DMT)-like permease